MQGLSAQHCTESYIFLHNSYFTFCSLRSTSAPPDVLTGRQEGTSVGVGGHAPSDHGDFIQHSECAAPYLTHSPSCVHSPVQGFINIHSAFSLTFNKISEQGVRKMLRRCVERTEEMLCVETASREQAGETLSSSRALKIFPAVSLVFSSGLCFGGVF